MKKNSNHETAQHSEQEPKRYWRSARSPEGKKKTLGIFQTANRRPSR